MSTALAFINNTLFGVRAVGDKYLRTTEIYNIPYPIDFLLQAKVSTLEEAKLVIEREIETKDIMEISWNHIFFRDPILAINEQIFKNQYQAYAMFVLMTRKQFFDLKDLLYYMEVKCEGMFEVSEFKKNIDVWHEMLERDKRIQIHMELLMPPIEATATISRIKNRKTIKFEFKCFQT